MRKASVLLVAIALAMFGLAACGGDDGNDEDATEETTVEATTAGGGGSTVEITAAADGSLAYDQDSVDAKAGPVTINFDNPSSTPHDVNVENSGDLGGTDIISESSTSTTIDLQAGEYTFFCSVPGHREGGMEGTLTVN
jgi:plastocyanin